MTEIVVASRDGILRAPNGEQFRLVRGKTLADARHPAVQAYPDNFMPMRVELSMEDADPGHLEDAFSTELAEAKEDARQATEAAEEYRAQLVAITDVLMARGGVPADVDTDEPGWLAKAVGRALDATAPADDEPVPPPAAARTRKPPAPKLKP
jgi:hypothetical protein